MRFSSAYQFQTKGILGQYISTMTTAKRTTYMMGHSKAILKLWRGASAISFPMTSLVRFNLMPLRYKEPSLGCTKATNLNQL